MRLRRLLLQTARPRSGWHSRTIVTSRCRHHPTGRSWRHSGGWARDYLPGFAILVGVVMVQYASGCPYLVHRRPRGGRPHLAAMRYITQRARGGQAARSERPGIPLYVCLLRLDASMLLPEPVAERDRRSSPVGAQPRSAPETLARIWHRRPLGAAHSRCEPDVYVKPGPACRLSAWGLRQLRRAGHRQDELVSPRLGYHAASRPPV